MSMLTDNTFVTTVMYTIHIMVINSINSQAVVPPVPASTTPEAPAVPLSPPPAQKNPRDVIMFVILLLLIAVIGWLIWTTPDVLAPLYKRSVPLSATPTPTATPTPIQLIQGKETYSISQAKLVGPTISTVTFDPLDVHLGETLTVTVTVADTVPITDVVGKLQTDGAPVSFTLDKVSETGNQSVWTGTVTPTDTLWYTYILTITATSTNGTRSAAVAPRS